MIKSYSYLTVEQNQRMSLLKARAAARAEYKEQGICTDLFYDDFVADCSCEHCKQYRAGVRVPERKLRRERRLDK
jgi:hypothetical protein